MWEGMFDGMVRALVLIGIGIGLIVCGCVYCVDYFFFDNHGVIKVEQQLVPELEINVINGVADTTYVYRTE